MGAPHAPLAERFRKKVRVSGDNECWEWQAAKDGHGYGAIAASGERRTLQAHRVAYELANGPIPDGLQVLHRCDNPGCVKPAHLFLGTHQDNMADMCAKGRLVTRGRGLPTQSALTDEDVRVIRASQGRQWEIGARFGIKQPAVSRIKTGRSWAHVQ